MIFLPDGPHGRIIRNISRTSSSKRSWIKSISKKKSRRKRSRKIRSMDRRRIGRRRRSKKRRISKGGAGQ